MSLAQPYLQRGDHFQSDGRPTYGRSSNIGMRAKAAAAGAGYSRNYNSRPNLNFYQQNQGSSCEFSQYYRVSTDALPSSKRRKFSNLPCESTHGLHQQRMTGENIIENLNVVSQCVPQRVFSNYSDAPLVCKSSSVAPSTYRLDSDSASMSLKRDRSNYEGDEAVFMSRDDIDRISPSRKDGIDVLHETHLRYSYCAFLQNLGMRLDLPVTTIGTAMVLCHRFFLHRSHASHDRFMIATAVLFLTSKSEETPRPLNDVLRTSCEILHGQDFNVLSYMLPIGWFEQYRERITDAEHLILTTLNFELSVQHPYDSLTTTLHKLGFSQSVLVNLALSLVSEGGHRGLACSSCDINCWWLICCSPICFSSEVELDISCGCLFHDEYFLRIHYGSNSWMSKTNLFAWALSCCHMEILCGIYVCST